MREILFKAKRIDNGEWVEGFYLKYVKPINGEIEHRIFISDFDGITWYAVDENTICQYTGLTDKNGNKIWENDIVKENSCGYIGFIEYMGAEYRIEWNGEPYIRHDILFWIQSRELEVIGNIFDNPGLLEGGAV